MSRSNTYSIRYRRKREGKTDYKKRLRLLLNQKPRLVVRSSLKHIRAQLIEYNEKGDKILTQADSSELKKMGWPYKGNNIPASYLVGLLIGKKSKDKKITDAILDMGLKPSVKGSKIYSVLKGALDAGMNIPHSKDILPDDTRINGKHIASYSKNNINEQDIQKNIEDIKKKLTGV